jgi:hypothetical protein
LFNFKKIEPTSMNLFILILYPLSLLIFPLSSSASAGNYRPGQVSTTCSYNAGPKIGKEENLEGKIKPLMIGSPCTDSEGSSGSAVVDEDDKESVAAAAKMEKRILNAPKPENN